MKVLVTGGFGYLGSICAEKLHEKGYEIRILGRHVPDYLRNWSKKFDLFLGDVTNKKTLINSCKDVDAVIHFAALNEVLCKKDPVGAINVNGLGTLNMLDVAFNEGVERFIYISTFHVYGIPKTNVITEETCPNPVNSYSITHRLAEMYCQQYKKEFGLSCVILRVSNGYGAPIHLNINRWSLVINDFCRQAIINKKILLLTKGTQERDFVSIPDIIQAISLMLKVEEEKISNSNIFNVGTGYSISIKKLADIIAEVYEEIYNEKITIEYNINKKLKETDTVKAFKYDISKIKKLGYSPFNDMRNEILKLFKMCEKLK